MGLGKMSFSLFVSALGVSEFALGQANTPQQWSQAVLECGRSCILEDRFSFCCLLQFDECLPTQFREAGYARLTREADGGCEQLIGDVQGKMWIVAGQSQAGASSPHQPLPKRLHHSIGFRSEERRVGKECRSRWSPY